MKRSRKQGQAPRRDSPPQTAAAGALIRGESRHWLLLGVAALLVATPLVPSEYAAARLLHVQHILLWIILLVLWAFREFARGRLELRFSHVDALVAAFFIAIVVSTLVMAPHGNARAAINSCWMWVSLGVAFFLLRQLVREPVESRALCALMIALAACLSTHGLWQFAYEFPQMRASYFDSSEQQKQAILAENGVSGELGSEDRKNFENRLASTEPTATFSLTNSLAGYLAPWLIVGLAIGGSTWTSGGLTARTAIGILFVALLLSACLVLTKSRAGWLATMLGAALVAVATLLGQAGSERWRRHRWKILAGGGVAIVVVALLVGAGIALGAVDVQVLTEAQLSVRYRLQYWQGAAAMVAAHPWFGCGVGNFQQYYTHFKLVDTSETISDPHNFLMEIASTAGILAATLFIAILAGLAVRIVRPNNSVESNSDAPSDTISGGVYFIYAAGPVGVLLGYLCGLPVGFPPSAAILLLGLPVAAAVVWLLHKWVARGALARYVIPLGLAVFMVNLVAAGGVSFPGVAVTMWLAFALILNRQEAGAAPRVYSARGALAAAALVVAAAMFYFFAVGRPNLNARKAVDEALQMQGRHPMQQKLELAATIDPYWPEPWRVLAALHLQQWSQSQQSERFDQFERCANEFVRRDPQSSNAYLQQGNWYLQAFRRGGDSAHAQSAIAAYRRAVELYPTSNAVHAQLAWGHHLAGDDAEARRFAQLALDFDGQKKSSNPRLSTVKIYDPGPHIEQRSAQPPPPAEGKDAQHAMRALGDSR